MIHIAFMISTTMLIIFICMALTQTLATFVDNYYYKRDGIKLLKQDGSNPDCPQIDLTPNPMACALACLNEPSCLSFSYKEEVNCCVLNEGDLYNFKVQFLEDPAWAYYGPSRFAVTADDWTLVFKAVSGSDQSLWNTYLGPSLSHDLDLTNVHPAHFSVDFTSIEHPFYRSHWLDNWPTGGVNKVKVGLYTNGKEDAFLEFDGTGSNNEDWFSKTRVTNATWNDLDAANPAMFSAPGLANRKFYVALSNDYTKCDNLGWMLVVNMPGNMCVWDKESPRPQFLYSRGGGGTYLHYQVYGKAHVFAVFVKF